MRRMIPHRPSPAMIVAVVALLVALGGGAYAAVSLPKHSVGTKQLRKSSVGTRQLKKNAVTSAKVKNGSLLTQDFATGQLPAGLRGPQGPEGPPGPERPPNPNAVFAQNADKLDNLDSTDFLRANGKAADADKLDGIDSTDLAQSNVFFAGTGTHAFTVPAQLTGVVAELRGAGGGGDFFNSCGSAGQGGFVRAYLAVNAGDTLTVTVGTGGFGGSGSFTNGQAGGASSLAKAGTTLVTASGGAGGTCSAGGTGGDASVTAPAVGVEKVKGADGTLSGNNNVQVPGGGPPGFFGSGDDSGASPAGFQGTGGYVLLHLLR